MHEPRFPRPYYAQQHSQWKPYNPRFRPRCYISPNFMPSQFSPRWRSYNSYNQVEEYWCETCDRGFQTMQLLENHNKQHQKCNIDGCQFMAHPKVITKHIQMQHSTGLFKKIAKLDNPEEIKRWREERKKRYPTKDNVDKKNAEMKEKVERGEKIGMAYKNRYAYDKRECGMKRKHTNVQNQRHNNKRPFQANHISRNIKNSNISIESKSKPPAKKEYPVVLLVQDKPTLKPFTGIQYMLEENESDIDVKENSCSYDDDYYLVEEDINQPQVEPTLCGALTSLISCYSSSGDESSSEISKVKNVTLVTAEIKSDLTNFDENNGVKICEKDPCDNQNSDEDCAPEEIKNIKTLDVQNSAVISQSNTNHTNVKNPKTVMRKNIRSENVFNRNNSNTYKSRMPSTFLEKLLSNEIRQERNIVLQCIRHIVKNNYFEKLK